MDIVRVIRIIEYTGPRDWVETTIAESIHGTKVVSQDPERIIRAVTLGDYAEIMKKAEAAHGS